MATSGLDSFAAFLQESSVNVVPFKAEPYYEPGTDSIIYYMRDERSYSTRVTKFFTLFLSTADDSLVGFEIKGVKTLAKAIEGLDGEYPVAKATGVKGEDGVEGDFSLFMRQALVPEHEQPVDAELQVELNNATRGVRVPRRQCKMK